MPRYLADQYVPSFCTITVLDWLPVLIASRYIDPIIESLSFSRQNKGLHIFGFVIMPNHLHLICYAGECLHTIMRDFKRFTSRALHDRLKEDGRQSILHWLKSATQQARRSRGESGLWQDGFHPQAVSSREVFAQKLNYLHENPVRKGLVRRPEHWWYSSASCYCGREDVCLEVDRA